MPRILQLSSVDVVLDEELSSSIAEEFTSSEEEIALNAAAGPVMPRAYAGGAYYTPLYGTEDFYTPWGNSSFETGLGYLKLTIGAATAIALFIFVLPYTISAIRSLIEDVKKGMK